MDMEIGEEFIVASTDRAHIVKGRRTKRHRSSSPYKAGLTASSSSSGYGKGEDSEEKEEVVVEENGSVFSSTTTSSDVYESTEEEEDMANCLILLAKGDGPRQARKISISPTPTPNPTTNTNSSGISKMAQKFADFATSSSATTGNKASFYVYECKTCNRSFPSFQALGGHRASHKKPKPSSDQETTKKLPSATSCLPLLVDNIKLEDCSLNKKAPYCPSPDNHFHVSLQIGTTSNTTNSNANKGHQGNNNNTNKVAKVHECSICGSEFNSGQALGGHMRRHRASAANNSGNVIVNQVGLSDIGVTVPIIEEVAHHKLNGQDHGTIKPRNVLSLDLNLPAPEDDHYQHQHQREPKFEFVTTKQTLVFSAPTLVGCHY